jgi:hypothetical protein
MPETAASSTNQIRILASNSNALILTGHAAAAAAWGWLMPGGFAVGHARFWVNGVLPWILMTAALSGRFFKRTRPAVLTAFAFLWISAAVSARLSFPITCRILWVGPLFAGLAIGALALAEFGFAGGPLRAAPIAFAAGLAALVGAALPIAQRPAIADTSPANIALPEEPSGNVPQTAGETVQLTGSVDVLPNDGTVILHSGQRSMAIRPLLTFQSRSPDGCWTLLASGKARRGPERKMIQSSLHGSEIVLFYHDDDLSMLTVDVNRAAPVTRIEAASRLPRPVWSHLNTFTELAIAAQGQISVSFSPCPDARIEVRVSDYPFGRPARFTYLAADDTFHVVEARSAEKGPFRHLASGFLARNAPLEMTFFDDGTPIFRVVLNDWAAQASRQISPTAGWSVPVNAIEFSFEADSVAQVFITLAATSVGRGYESVGHAAGVYRNRMSIVPLVD